jgi:hypothetical protein
VVVVVVAVHARDHLVRVQNHGHVLKPGTDVMIF